MTIEPEDFAEATRISDEIIAKVMPMLAGHPPALQGIIVVELLAIWVAGHHPVVRDQMLKLQLETLPGLVELWHERMWAGRDA